MVNLASYKGMTRMKEQSAELEKFRQNPDEALAQLYRSYRGRFVQWARGWCKLDEAELAEIFQDAVVIFWNNIREQKLTQLKAASHTYVFSVGRRLILSKFRQMARTQLLGDAALPEAAENWDPGIENLMIQDEDAEMLSHKLEQLGEPCYTLLKLSFYESKRSAEIAAQMNYSSDDVVRTQKKRCLDRLRKLFSA
ncbi:MAG: sigma-70 family RNA polymerase sigma factor [Saprospiraceae bacterium]